MREKLIESSDGNIVYDYTMENRRSMLVAGLLVLKRPTFHLVCNISYLSFVLFLHAFLIVIALATIVRLAQQNIFMEKTLHTTALLFVSLSLLAVNYCSRSEMKIAIEILTRIQDSADEVFASEYRTIKKKCVKQIRRFVDIVMKLCLCNAFANSVLVSVISLVSRKTYSVPGLNPYLPFPLFMPFDTTTFSGFCVAFLSNTGFVYFMNVLSLCIITIYVSFARQLIAQIDILNHSLSNIELRAYSKLRKSCSDVPEGGNERLYERVEFQAWLYLCLRHNVLHHQSIIRLKQAMDTFWRPINFIGIIAFAVVSSASLVNILEDPKRSLVNIFAISIETFCYLQVCMVGENVKLKSEEIINVLYSTPWPHCNKQFNALLKVMIMKAQELIILRAACTNTPSSLETFSKVSSFGYKIVNLMRQ